MLHVDQIASKAEAIWHTVPLTTTSVKENFIDGFIAGYQEAKLPEKTKRLIKYKIGDVIPIDAEFMGKLMMFDNIEYAYYEVYE